MTLSYIINLYNFFSSCINFAYHFTFFPCKKSKMILFVAQVWLLITVAFAVLILMQITIWTQLSVVLFVLYDKFNVVYIFLITVTYSSIFRVYRRQIKIWKNTQRFTSKICPGNGMIIVTFVNFRSTLCTVNVCYIFKCWVFYEVSE